MKHNLIILAAALTAVVSSCSGTKEEGLSEMISRSLDRAHSQALYLAKSAEPLEGQLPRTFENGELKTADYRSWICGFFPGTLWQLADRFPEDTALKSYAREFTDRIAPAQYLTDTHDLGFMVFCSAGKAYEVTHEEKYREMVLTAAKSLSTRFSGKTGVIMSWNPSEKWRYPVIIDNMMNLEMLEWAGKESADSSMLNIALSHARTTLKNHFRDDYSCYHVVSYDPETGIAEKKQTHQGYSDDSAWARGQAWALYGFTMMYRETHEEDFLAQAKNVANYIAGNPRLPEDGVPYWDFDDPAAPETPRDASAAAVMAHGFLELSLYDTENAGRWREIATKQLRTLSSPEYLAAPGEEGGFILKHSVGNKNKNSEVDVPLSYADYYYVEALLLLENILKQE